MKNDVQKTCAFIGHRPLNLSFGFDEEHATCVEIKERISDWIGIYVANGFNTFIYGGELGADMWAAELVIQLQRKLKNIKLYGVLPSGTHADKWKPEQQERHFNILGKCEGVKTLNTIHTANCIKQRNECKTFQRTILILYPLLIWQKTDSEHRPSAIWYKMWTCLPC